MHQSERAKAPFRGAQAADVGQHQARGVPDNDVVDLAGAMHERSDLPARLARSVGQRTHQLGRGYSVAWHSATVNALQRLDGTRRKTGRVSVELRHAWGAARQTRLTRRASCA